MRFRVRITDGPNSTLAITVDTLQLSSTLSRFTDEHEQDQHERNGNADEGGTTEVSLESQLNPKGKSARKSESHVNDHNSDDTQEVPIHRNKFKACRTSTQHGRGGTTEGLKRLLEASEARKEARDEKRIKSEEAREEKRIKAEEGGQLHRTDTPLQRGLLRFGLAAMRRWPGCGKIRCVCRIV